MKIRYNYEDFLFLSARIRSLENGLISREKMVRMASSSGMAELSRQFSDCGITAEENEYGVKNYEKALSERLKKAYETVFSGSGDSDVKALFAFFTYQYDCHNLKSAIKAAAKGISTDGLLLPFGSVETAAVTEAVRSGDYSAFPANLANAAKEAAETYAKTSDPQRIDLIIDRACFEDIKAESADNPVKFFGQLLELKADTLNIFTSLRLCRMPSGEGKELMERAYLPGGSLSKEFFLTGVSRGEEFIAEELKHTGYGDISGKLSSGKMPLAKLEQLTDDMFMSKIREARQTLSGAEVLAGYLAATETEIKNLRIVLAGKKAGKKPEEITERLRECYV